MAPDLVSPTPVNAARTVVSEAARAKRAEAESKTQSKILSRVHSLLD
jgi:hypothetical protein